MNRFMAFFIVALTVAAPARADYFVWQDPASGLTMTFPDTWKVQSNQQPDDILTIQAPASDNAQPTCRVRARDERRALIFPPEYSRSVQRTFVSQQFWKDYMGAYDNYNLGPLYEGGLGRGFGSYTTASYVKRDGTVYQTRSGIMFAAIYFDKLYIVDCSSLSDSFTEWVMPFRSIVKSIDFRKAHHERDYGDYANFLKQADYFVWAQTGPEGTTAY